MTKFEEIKSKNIDELAEWLNEHGKQDYALWDMWFDKNYCSKCEPITVKNTDYPLDIDCAWCELNENKCKFFPDMDEPPWGKQLIKLWLETED